MLRLAHVESIDKEKQLVNTTIGEIRYDYLVIAIGCTTNFFGNKGISEHALTLKSTLDAIKIINHILLNFEKISVATEKEKEPYLNLVIVGAGPTGVELSGAFAEIKKPVLPKDYNRIDFSKFNIYLIEGSSNTLNNMSDNAKKNSKKFLEKMGVTLLTERKVLEYDGENL